MASFLTSMIVHKWELVAGLSCLAGGCAAAVAAYQGSDFVLYWAPAVAFVSFLGQTLLVPKVIGYSMQRSFAQHFDMNPQHMKAVWTGGNPAESNMIVSSYQGMPVGVVAVLAGSAKVAMTALRLVRTRGPRRTLPLFGESVQEAAQAAHDGKSMYRPCSVFRVSVHASMRGQGLGRQLMAAAEDWAQAHGYSHVELTTASPTAIKFYKCLGYSVHYTKFSIFDFRVVHMSKQLPQAPSALSQAVGAGGSPHES